MWPQIIQSYSIGFLQCQTLVTEHQRRPTRFRKLSANRPGRQHTKLKYMLTENSYRRQQRHIHKALLGKCRSHCHTAVLASHVVALFGGLVVVVDVWVAIHYLLWHWHLFTTTRTREFAVICTTQKIYNIPVLIFESGTFPRNRRRPLCQFPNVSKSTKKVLSCICSSG